MNANQSSFPCRRAAALLLACLVFLGGGGAALSARGETETPAGLYAASLSDAEVFIDLPALRQYGGYTCGAACVQMLMNWLFPYAADLNLAQYEALLGTTPEDGTPPDAILAFLEESGVAFDASQGMTLDQLRECLGKGQPVLIALQAWSSAEDGSYNVDDPAAAGTYLAEGHWVICVGYGQSGDQPCFIFNDPACVGHVLMDGAELEHRWIDQDAAGTIFDHFGIVICQTTAYDPNGLFYME